MEANQHSKQTMKNIEHILEKYWQGETSRIEEDQLRTFFNQPHIPNHLEIYQPLFAYQLEEKQKRVSDKFEEDVLEKIRAHEVPMKPTSSITRPHAWLKYAAIVLIGLAIFASYQYYQSFNQTELITQKDTLDNPEEAYQEARRALLLVSSHLNKGEKEMSRLSTFTKVQDTYLLKN